MENTEQINSLIELFTIAHYSDDIEDVKKIFISVAKFYENNHRHQYYKISKYVYEKMNQEPDSLSYILNNISQLQFIVKCSMQEYESLILEKNINIKCEDVVNSLAKLYDHIALEEERLINNDKTVRESGEKLQNDLVYNFNAMANSITQKFNDMSNAQNANIMTIVGLFSAIIFVFFGGVTGLSSVIKGIFELSKKEDLAIPLIIIMFIGLMLFDIVFMLLYSIAKILNRDIGRMVFDGSYHCYWYEQNGDFFHVKDECNKIVSCTNEECKAQKICKRKNRIPKCRSKMKTVINAIILRYPMVFLFNLFGIGLISYLLTKV